MSGVADTTSRRLLAQLAQRQVGGRLPSLVAGVVRDGELVWSGGYGDLGGVTDITDRQYRIGSITKTFTAVLVLQLVRDGRLDLAEPASDVIGDVGYADRSVRSLLSHSSGMQAEPHGSWWERSDGCRLGSSSSRPTTAPTASSRPASSTTTPTSASRCSARSRRVCTAPRGSRRCAPASWSRSACTRTSYLPEEPAAPGWSVDPYAGTLTREPATDTALDGARRAAVVDRR